MRSTSNRHSGRLAALLALAALIACAAPAALAAAPPPPHASTGAAQLVRGSTALLTGVVNPNNQETTYFFQWGPTPAYGSQTTPASANGAVKVKVGQAISGLLPATTYHYRLVAEAGGTQYPGGDRTFLAGNPAGRLQIRLSRPAIPDVFGSPVVLGGVLSGTGAANHAIALQASPYPFLQPFVTIGLPGRSNEAGAFSFRVSNLLLSTEFRIVTLDPLPIFSSPITEHVAVKVTLHVKHSSVLGLVRLYGTVTPAQPRGARVLIRLQKTVRPHGSEESTTRLVTITSTPVKHGAAAYSRFSIPLRVPHTGRYIAVVELTQGPLVSGASSSVLLHAAADSRRHR